MGSHSKEICEQINIADSIFSIKDENFFEHVRYCSDSGEISIDWHDFIQKKNIFNCGKRYGGK